MEGRFRLAGDGVGDGEGPGPLRFRGEGELEEGVVMVFFSALDIGLRGGRVEGDVGIRFIVAFDFPEYVYRSRAVPKLGGCGSSASIICQCLLYTVYKHEVRYV